MNFEFSDDQLAIVELADAIFRDYGEDERVRRIYENPEPFDEELWTQLAQAGFLGAVLPEDDGGINLGMLEFSRILQAQGTSVTAVPLWRHTLAGLAVASFGSDALRQAVLPGLIDGSTIATIASDPLTQSDLRATQKGSQWELTGNAFCVTIAPGTQLLVAPARVADGRTMLFTISLDEDRLSFVFGHTTSHERIADINFDGLILDETCLLESGDALEWLAVHSALALSSLQLGVTSEFLDRAAIYTGEREQFGRPIGSFQIVAGRMADAYVQLELLRTATWQLAWRMDQGLDVAASARIAKYQASEAGHIVGHTAQHYHGGVGADLTYPAHRFFLWAAALDLAGGGAEYQLQSLAAIMPPSVGPDRRQSA